MQQSLSMMIQDGMNLSDKKKQYLCDIDEGAVKITSIVSTLQQRIMKEHDITLEEFKKDFQKLILFTLLDLVNGQEEELNEEFREIDYLAERLSSTYNISEDIILHDIVTAAKQYFLRGLFEQEIAVH